MEHADLRVMRACRWAWCVYMWGLPLSGWGVCGARAPCPRAAAPNSASGPSPRLGHLDQNLEKKIARFWVTRLHAGCPTGLSLESPSCDPL